MSRLTSKEIRLRCDGIAENLHNVRRELDVLVWAFNDVSSGDPACSVDSHIKNVLKATADALMLLNEADAKVTANDEWAFDHHLMTALKSIHAVRMGLEVAIHQGEVLAPEAEAAE